MISFQGIDIDFPPVSHKRSMTIDECVTPMNLILRT